MPIESYQLPSQRKRTTLPPRVVIPAMLALIGVAVLVVWGMQRRVTRQQRRSEVISAVTTRHAPLPSPTEVSGVELDKLPRTHWRRAPPELRSTRAAADRSDDAQHSTAMMRSLWDFAIEVRDRRSLRTLLALPLEVRGILLEDAGAACRGWDVTATRLSKPEELERLLDCVMLPDGPLPRTGCSQATCTRFDIVELLGA